MKFRARRILYSFPLLAMLAHPHPTGAQSIRISGKVTDADGRGLSGAKVTLVGRSLSTTSGADGSFLLEGAASIGAREKRGSTVSGIAMMGRRLAFRVTAPGTRVRVEVKGLDGRLLGAMPARLLEAGNHVWELPASAGTGMRLITLVAGDVTTTFKSAGLGEDLGYFGSPAALPLAKSSAVDTLSVRLAGYIHRRAAIEGYTARVEVQLNPQMRDPDLAYAPYLPAPTDRPLSRSEYRDRLHGFWLGQCIANWTGLVTEMDRIGSPFYTDADWGKRDQRNIWGFYGPHPDTLIDFVFTLRGKPWGADDDTDLEYMYQHLLDVNDTSLLSPAQISAGWQKHIKAQEENFLWVSNQRAFDLMRAGTLPPETSLPANNVHYDMIDAQLTTEIFGLFAPGRTDIAARMAHLPIRTTAYGPAEAISLFYVTMHSLAPIAPAGMTLKEKVLWMAAKARAALPDNDYPAKMYDFVHGRYASGTARWETVRDELHTRYQVNRADGYAVPGRAGVDCGGCFAAGINFASGLVSLFYGEGDLKKTLRIGTLTGWDSDNPTATWGGLLGFMLGKQGVEAAFARDDFSDTYWIHRTRQGFPDRTPGVEGEDSLPMMAERGIHIIDRVVLEEMKGGVDPEADVWHIPAQP